MARLYALDLIIIFIQKDKSKRCNVEFSIKYEKLGYALNYIIECNTTLEIKKIFLYKNLKNIYNENEN